jgi:hypothetical protein
MSEKNMWVNVRKKMVPKFWSEATRHEDAYQRGIADVSFVQNGMGHGWMELKFRAISPLRPSTICKIDHYTDEQRNWLKSKGNAGGATFLLLQLKRDFLLFDHAQCQSVGKVTTADLYNMANWVSTNGLDARGLWEAINEHG